MAYQTRATPLRAIGTGVLKMLHGYRDVKPVTARFAVSKMGVITSLDSDGYTSDDFKDTHALVMSAEPGGFEQIP